MKFKAIAICLVLLVFSSSTVIGESNEKIEISNSVALEVKPEPKPKATFNKNNIRVKSNVNAKQLEDVLDDTELSGLATHVIDAEKSYNINALFMVALMAHESGWGESQRAKENNLTGFAVYTSSSRGAMFESKRENILKTAELLDEDFLSEDGINYNGLSVVDVNKKYCFEQDQKTIDYNWSKSITKIADDLKEEIISGGE